MSIRPGFWEVPVVQKSHGRVRGLTRENTHERRLSPLKRRSRPCPAQETSPRWSFGKGLLGRAESSLTSRDRRAQQWGCPASARCPCWPRQPLLSTVTARGGLRPPEDTAHMLGLSPGPGEAVCGGHLHLPGAREDTGTSAGGPRRTWKLGVPARSLHVLQLLLVQGLQPADHGLVHGLQPLGVQVLQQQQDGSQDVVPVLVTVHSLPL